MGSIDELIALISADIGKSDSGSTSIDATRSFAQDLADLFRAMDVDGQAARTDQVEQTLAEALGQCAAVKAKLEEAKARAEALKTPGAGGGATVSAASMPTPLTAAPQAIREPVAKVGDPVKPVEDVDASEDNDRSRLDRLGRRFSRQGSGEVEKLAKQHSEAGEATLHGYESLPPQGNTEAGVSQPHTPVISSTVGDTPHVTDFWGTLVLGTSVGFQAAGRIAKRRRDQKSE